MELEKPELTDEEKKMTALEHNIKTKGQNAYYYAHGRKYEMENSSEGKTIQGPGIITGGDPILLEKTAKDVKVIKSSKIFDKYLFCDDDEFAEVKIDLAIYYKDPSVITQDCIEAKIEKKSLKMIINEPGDSQPRQLLALKLFKNVVPNDSFVKIVKGKVIIRLKKEDFGEEWDKLNA